MTKVLLFESDEDVAAELEQEFYKLGCAVRVVSEGELGLRIAQVVEPDLVVVSGELPGMSGFALCDQFKQDPVVKGVPVILLSTPSNSSVVEQHKKGATRAEDYVHKPVAFSELLRRIQRFVAI